MQINLIGMTELPIYLYIYKLHKKHPSRTSMAINLDKLISIGDLFSGVIKKRLFTEPKKKKPAKPVAFSYLCYSLFEGLISKCYPANELLRTVQAGLISLVTLLLTTTFDVLTQSFPQIICLYLGTPFPGARWNS